MKSGNSNVADAELKNIWLKLKRILGHVTFAQMILLSFILCLIWTVIEK